MAYPSYSTPRPPKPPIATHDLLISIGVCVLTLALGVVAAAMGLFSLAFLDYCRHRPAAPTEPSLRSVRRYWPRSGSGSSV